MLVFIPLNWEVSKWRNTLADVVCLDVLFEASQISIELIHSMRMRAYIFLNNWNGFLQEKISFLGL